MLVHDRTSDTKYSQMNIHKFIIQHRTHTLSNQHRCADSSETELRNKLAIDSTFFASESSARARICCIWSFTAGICATAYKSANDGFPEFGISEERRDVSPSDSSPSWPTCQEKRVIHTSTFGLTKEEHAQSKQLTHIKGTANKQTFHAYV